VKSAKQAVQEVLEQVPDSASFEDIQYRIFVRQKVQQGLDDAAADKIVTQEDLEKRLAKWLEP
jgi:hypothetical protein